MKALVLTHDPQIGLAELLVKATMDLWPECPFQFIIPRNRLSSPGFKDLECRRNVTLIPCAREIRATMKALLDTTETHEWVYWCVDDRFPEVVDRAAMNRVFDFVTSGRAEPFNAVKLIRWLEAIDPDIPPVFIGPQPFVFQKPVTTRGFWHHQFIRAGVLKSMFHHPRLPASYTLSQFNQWFHTMESVPFFQKTLLPEKENCVEFGEPLFRGRLTVNGLDALKRYRCPVPAYESSPLTIRFSDVDRQTADHPKHPKIAGYFQKKTRIIRHILTKGPVSPESTRRNPAQPDILVCSFGGVGSKCLVKGILGTHDKDVLRRAHSHRRQPPQDEKRHIIYLFGNPMNAVISFFNRREKRHERCGFHSTPGPGDKHWVMKHCRHLEGECDALDPEWGLEEYVANGRDILKLEEHFDTWIRSTPEYPILFVKYETMWDHLPEIFDFVDLPVERSVDFPPREQRSSCLADQKETVKTGLVRMYGALQKRIEAQPDIRIHKGRGTLQSQPGLM